LPQTRFVLRKARAPADAAHRDQQVDRPTHLRSAGQVYDLFIDLDATEQLDFPVL
jgi:predicted membrane GTPase involved in stress response